MERINVVVTIDDKYSMLCGITLISLLDNCSKPELVDIYVVSDKGKLSKENKKKLIDCVKPRMGRIFFKEFVLADFLQYKVRAYQSEAIWYRIFVPRLLSNLKKYLYLDSDLLVVGDISEIYFSDLGKKWIGAVADQGEKINPNMVKHYKRVVGVNKYFNAGVVLINTKIWCKINAEKKMIALIKTGKMLLEDQDALNTIFVGKVFFFSPKWNFFFKNLIFDLWHFFDNPNGLGIIHYQSPYKPFSSPRITRYEFAYMHYLLNSPWKKIVAPRLLLKLLHPFFCIKLFFLVLKLNSKQKNKKN